MASAPVAVAILPLDRPHRARQAAWAFGLCGALIALHAVVWALALHRHPITVRALLDHWDGGAYAEIARHGYHGPNWAYFPLFPALSRLLSPLFGSPELAGAVLSTASLLGFVALAVRLPRGGAATALLPESHGGWLAFLFAPVSWVFHANHTEALFLLLSFLALACAATRRPLRAGLFAACCILTRNQGFILAVCTGLLAASAEEGRARRWRAFLLAGAISAIGAFALFAFEWLGTGHPLAFVLAQKNWTHASSLADAVRALWFGNPWQCTDRENLIRYAGFLVLIAASVALATLAQGELVNALRFGVVLFPAWFWLGDRFARAPRWIAWPAALALVLLNLHIARAYALARWAY